VAELEKEIAKLTAIPPLYDPARFQHVKISEYLQDFIKENPQYHTRVRLNRLLLEAAYPDLIATSKGGVYPDREIYIATPEDSQRCFQEYLADAQRRLQLNQLKPGEDVKVIDSRVQVSGQVAVMAINGLLTKVMFDANPKNEFYVEESFPLDWMYPHLTPYGIIMKINRQQLPELTQDIVDTDHQFWSTYSERLIGNWITYDTSVKEISEFVERVYLRRNLKGFTGDPKFVRDDQAQKAFSKLRSSIGGVYNWRIGHAKSPAEQQRMIKEADFAFKQALAFCPYSPEAVFRYVNLLLMLQRYQDAYIVASTCQKLDPYNAQVVGLVENLRKMTNQPAPANVSLPLQQDIPQLEKAVQANPADFQSAFNLAALFAQGQQFPRAVAVLTNIIRHPKADSAAFRAAVQAFASMNQRQQIQSMIDFLQGQLAADSNRFDAALGIAEASRALQQNDTAVVALDSILNNPRADANAVLQVAQVYAALANFPRLEATLDKLVLVAPTSPEAWYDLAAMKASLNKNSECLIALGKAIDLSESRLKIDTNARNLVIEARKDERFKALRDLPEFKKIARL
jgi:tetratricopeptide (TPR) repeat protein